MPWDSALQIARLNANQFMPHTWPQVGPPVEFGGALMRMCPECCACVPNEDTLLQEHVNWHARASAS